MTEQKSPGFFARLFGGAPENLPGTTITKEELAQAIGLAIKDAFREYIPQPDRMASAVTEAAAGAARKTGEEIEKIQKHLVESQMSLLEKWQGSEKKAADQLASIEKTLGKACADLAAGATKMDDALRGHIKGLKEGLASTFSAAKDELEPILKQHAEKLKEANQELAAQLEKIISLEKEIQKVLHVQEVTDGTLKTVAASEEFVKMMGTLRSHIEESDKLLREVSKPRTIRLIETETETTQP